MRKTSIAWAAEDRAIARGRDRRRRFVLLGPLLILAVAGGLWAAAFPGDLGVDEAQARQTVDSAVRGGFVSVWAARNALRAADGSQRARMVEQALAWARSYTESPEFAAEYARARADGKPQPPAAKPPVEEELKQQRAEQRRQVEEMKKSAASLPADQRKMIEDAVAQMTAEMARMEKDTELLEMQTKFAQMAREQEQQAYAEALKRWENDSPADPRPLIATRLRKFLDTCADVDFDAKLVAAGTRMRFEDPLLEKKPGEWKLCYRAGREAVAAARAAATAWLAALQP